MSDVTDINDRVLSVIAKCFEVEPSAVSDDMAQFSLDSLDQIEIAIGLEEEFELPAFEDDVIWPCKTVSDFQALVLKALA
tara:strand:+ start:354 stop:593 length:240 start_codon:yes stop_codon:yes gene_type:complete